MVILSIDLGLKRTGLAICDRSELLPSPLCVVDEQDLTALKKKIAHIAKEHQAGTIVVGLPKNMDGSEGESAKRARKFAEALEDFSGIRCEMQDERGTTITANSYLNLTNTRGKKRKKIIDSVAATIILEDYLARKKNRLK